MTEQTSTIVNTIIFRSIVEYKTLIRPMKLQKLLYYSFGRCLVDCNVEIINESFQVWQYGCVVPSVYRVLKKYGKYGIRDVEPDENNHKRMLTRTNGGAVYETILSVLDTYIDYSDLKLSKLNHHKEGAWSRSKKENLLNIPLDYIREEFERAQPQQKE